MAGNASALARLLDALTTAAARAATSRLRANLDEAKQQMTLLWVRKFFSTAAPAPSGAALADFIAAALSIVTAALDPGVVNQATVTPLLLKAYAAGVDHALYTAPRMPQRRPHRDLHPPLDLAKPVLAARAKVPTTMTVFDVERRGFAAVLGSLVQAHVAVTRIGQAIAYEVTAAAAEAARDTASAVGTELIWVAEGDGCADCLGFSGEVTSGLTFGGPLGQTVLGPPLHPNCRCVLECWEPSVDEVGRRAVMAGRLRNRKVP